METNMESVLVTGGAGFIGSHTCKALAGAGFSPVAFDDLSKGHTEFVRWGTLIKGDILDSAALDAAFATSSQRCHPFRRARVCRGIDVAAACLLPG
jgi:UDP-glucose 4-epimerase